MLGDRRIALAGAGQTDDIENGFDHAFPDRKPAHEPLRRDEILGAHRGFWRRAGVAGRLDEDLPFGRAIGVNHIDLHEKAIELGLGQRVGALLLQRILRGQHVKGARQIMPSRRRP